MNDVTIKLGLDDSGLLPPVQRVNAAIGSIGKTGEISARQTAAAMRQLPAQFTDVATQLAGGSNPLLVLLQQGGQIKDSFGGIGPAVRGMAAAITPAAVGVGVLAAGVGVLAAAAAQGARESERLRDTLAMTGNAAGLTGARFQAMAEQVSDASQQTIGASKDILLQLTSTGQVTNTVLSTMAAAVGRVADVTGGDARKIAADFSVMSNGVAKWAAEHNKAWNFITVQQYRYIRGLEEQGKAEQAMLYVNRQVITHLEDQQRNLGYLESAWDGVRKTAGKAWDAMLGFGRDATVTGRLQEVQAEIRTILNASDGREPARGSASAMRIAALREQLEGLRKLEAAERSQADARARRAAESRSAIEAERAREAAAKAAARAAGGRSAGSRDFVGPPTFDEQFPLPNTSAIEAYRRDNETAAQAFRRSEIAAYKEISDYSLRQLVSEQEQRERNRRDEEKDLERMARDQRKRAERLAEDAGRAMYEDTRDALSAAFRDSKNPIEAFGNALASTIYTRATRSLVDALATAAVGPDGRGGALGSLINIIGSFTGGSTSGLGDGIDHGDGSAFPQLATGTNFVPRNMVAMLHQGEAVVPARYNPAAGGAGVGVTIHNTVQISVDARSDQAQVASLVYGAVQQGNQALVEDLQARGMIPA